MKIEVLAYDELDPVLRAYKIIWDLYQEASEVDTSEIDDESFASYLECCYYVPYVGLVDPTDEHPLANLEEYIRQRVMSRLERED